MEFLGCFFGAMERSLLEQNGFGNQQSCTLFYAGAMPQFLLSNGPIRPYLLTLTTRTSNNLLVS
ncbi:hypothetical protein D3C80_1457150 [compost metagenome]